MDFRELSYVLAIAKHKNLTRAADALCIGQPTLSKFLTALESDLGLKLFKRIGNRYELTYAGERYFAKAQEIINLQKDLEAELDDIRKNDVGSLKVAFAKMRYSYLTPMVLPEYNRLYPNVKLTVTEGASDENDKKLIDGQIDAAFYSMPYEANDKIAYETLSREELLICTCKDHPLAQYAQHTPGAPNPHLPLSVLVNERVILMKPEQRTRQIVDGIAKESNVRFKNVFYTTSIPAIMGLVANGFGVSFVFEPHLKHRENKKPIDCYSISGRRVFAEFVAATRKGGYISKYTRDFIDLVREYAEE